MSISSLIESPPGHVTVVEVGPRDGLQNQPEIVPTGAKIAFIESLAGAGLEVIEATSFVRPDRVPQMADAREVMRGIHRLPRVRYPVLVPNLEGLERALASGVEEVAIFASATEEFSIRNLGRSRAEALEMFRPVARRSAESGLRLRGYLSMVLGDPWEGPVDPVAAARQSALLFELGCDEISLGDTIGVGNPAGVHRLLEAVFAAGISPDALAVHFHDTYGQALVNVAAALTMGITIVDSSAGGLGGCPFARSATGNLATEDLVYFLDSLGIETGVDLKATAGAAAEVCAAAGIEVPGRVARAVLG